MALLSDERHLEAIEQGETLEVIRDFGAISTAIGQRDAEVFPPKR